MQAWRRGTECKAAPEGSSDSDTVDGRTGSAKVISLAHLPQAKSSSSRGLNSGCFGELGSVSLKPRPVFWR